MIDLLTAEPNDKPETRYRCLGCKRVFNKEDREKHRKYAAAHDPEFILTKPREKKSNAVDASKPKKAVKKVAKKAAKKKSTPKKTTKKKSSKKKTTKKTPKPKVKTLEVAA